MNFSLSLIALSINFWNFHFFALPCFAVALRAIDTEAPSMLKSQQSEQISRANWKLESEKRRRKRESSSSSSRCAASRGQKTLFPMTFHLAEAFPALHAGSLFPFRGNFLIKFSWVEWKKTFSTFMKFSPSRPFPLCSFCRENNEKYDEKLIMVSDTKKEKGRKLQFWVLACAHYRNSPLWDEILRQQQEIRNLLKSTLFSLGRRSFDLTNGIFNFMSWVFIVLVVAVPRLMRYTALLCRLSSA